MNINRQNYEEFFLLYVDNELTTAGKKAVEEFVQQNPDLEEELVMLQQSVLHPNPAIVFDKKESLLKNVPSGLVNESNYEEYFVLYSDNELTQNEKELVEQFVHKHPQYQQEFELLQQVKLIPDNNIVFPDKNDLYRTEEEDKVVPFPWRKLAVAAVILLFMGGFAWYAALNQGADAPGPRTGNSTNGLASTDTNHSKNNTPQNQLAANPAANEMKNNNIDQLPANPVAATTNSKKETIAAPKTNMRVKEALAVNTKKIVPSKSNIRESVNVLPIQEETVQMNRSLTANTVNTAVVETKPAIVDVAVNLRSAKDARTDLNIPDTKVVYVDAQPDDELYVDNNSSNKRPLRGLFRKVTRVFDKASNMDADEANNNKKGKGIRIASFEIALK